MRAANQNQKLWRKISRDQGEDISDILEAGFVLRKQLRAIREEYRNLTSAI